MIEEKYTRVPEASAQLRGDHEIMRLHLFRAKTVWAGRSTRVGQIACASASA
jgi:hypothetical protein